MNIRISRSAIWFTLAEAFVYMVNSGIRNNFGIMLASIAGNSGLTFASVSFVLAVGQLCFGVTQPLSGFAAERYGNRRTLLAGAFGIIAGAALLPLCRGRWTVLLTLGVLLSGSLGIVSYGLLLGTISPHIPDARRPLAGGLRSGMAVLAALAAVTVPVTLGMTARSGGAAPAEEPAARKESPRLSRAEMLRAARQSRDYQFIVAGFFTCGFHMALITNHLATEIVSCGYTAAQSAYAFSLYGIATIIGALVSGALSAKGSMKNLLGTLYGLRVAGVLAFLLLPKTMPVICGYIILLGLTGAATVTPVSGLCSLLFGAGGVAVFYSIAFFAHQIGGFLSAWLGGVCFDISGGSLWIWLADAVLCALASVVSFLIAAQTGN